MSAINPQQHSPALTVKHENIDSKAPNKKQQSASSTNASHSYDTYDKDGFVDPTGGLYAGAVKCGEVWRLPPQALVRTDRDNKVTLEAKDIDVSLKSENLEGQFKATMKKQAIEYSELEKRMHDLLGFTCESFISTFEASGQVTASGALEDGTFFSTSFAAFASAASITHLYTSNGRFAADYDANPQKAMESNFLAIKGFMESVVLRQSTDGKIGYSFEK